VYQYLRILLLCNCCRLASGPRPQVIAPELVPLRKTSPRRTDNLLGFVRSADTLTPSKHASLTSMCCYLFHKLNFVSSLFGIWFS
jgi:hypothetical protein